MAYFVRNHASSPNSIPREQKTLPSNPEFSEIPPVNEYREQEREAFGAGLPTPAGDREAFYTPSESAPARVLSPAIGSTNGTGGPRKIAAGAFRRNKPTPAIAAGPAASSTIRSQGSPSGSPRHSEQYASPPIAQQSYTPVHVSSGDYSGEPYNHHQRDAALDDTHFSDPGVDPALGLGSPLPPPPPAYGSSHGDAAVNDDDVYADAPQQGYQASQLVARDTDDGHLR
ncbi:hypothetical protein QFC22_003152 [Naganishia vaughanmartiniae]|uniref:Uncharacterized protein n=1 Tax=Naganishia vaughanmartiniae TaxID=1424756 RepID=A0ACC2XAB1_9TREE|nr:hypothetical protein QFC22_003152 [Naganishia vaughanmartiniae]